MRGPGGTRLHLASRDPDTGTWGAGRELTSIGATAGRWSPDGNHVLFTGRPEDDAPRGLYVISRDGGEARRLVETGAYADAVWSPDGSTIYYRSFDESGAKFWAISPTDATPRLVAQLDDPRHITRGGIQFATDGEKFYFAILEQETDIALAELVEAR